MIKISNLKIEYNKKTIIENFNLKIKEGEKIFLIGKSGVGKSSILDSFLIKNYTEGTISINKQNLNVLKPKDRRILSRKISLISQTDSFINDKTVFNNLYRLMNPKSKILKFFGISTNEDIERIYKTLKEFKIEDKAQTLISELSGGERKRVQIALSSLKNSKIILADEITSSLDIRNSQDIIDIILNSTNTAIIAAHDLEVIRQGSRIIGIKNKKIYFDLKLNKVNTKMIRSVYD